MFLGILFMIFLIRIFIMGFLVFYKIFGIIKFKEILELLFNCLIVLVFF